MNDYFPDDMPNCLGEACVKRVGEIKTLTFKWVRYSPKHNGKKKRFGKRCVGKKLCVKTWDLS